MQPVSDERMAVNSWEVLELEEVDFLGTTWVLLPSVYPMQRVRSTRIFWERLRTLGPVDRFLEVGCGSGILSVLAIKSGTCRDATAVDINPAAVQNTVLNARRHGVDDRLHILQSDLFDEVAAEDRFDLIFWNSPANYIEQDATLSYHERSIFDPGYRAHGRFLAEGCRRLTENGRLTLGFCGKGDLRLLKEMADRIGLSTQTLAEDTDGSYPHWLLEFRRE